MNLKETYNRIAEDWHKDHSRDDWWCEATNVFISFLNKGNRILDVGCGAGTKAKYLDERGLSVLGIDFSEKMIEIAKREKPEIDFRVMDMYDLPLLNEKFDGVFAQASLLHIPKSDVNKILGNFKTILKDGGFLYVAVKKKKKTELDEQIVKEKDYGYEYERFFSYFTFEEMKKYLTDLGMKIVYTNEAENSKRWIQIIVQK